MAPEITQVRKEVVADSWAVSPAKQAAAEIARNLPEKSTEQIVNALLARLRKKRKKGDCLRQIKRFIIVNHGSAVEFARRITRDLSLAEAAVSDTYLELLNGRTTVSLFYRALKMNARDLLEKRAAELRSSESLEGLISSAMTQKALSTDETQPQSLDEMDFPSPRLEDRDPLDILIARKEQGEYSDELEYAIRNVRCRGNRWILQTKWWKKSALAEWEKRQLGSDLEGSPE